MAIFSRCAWCGRWSYRDGLRVHRPRRVGYGVDDGLSMYWRGASGRHRPLDRIRLWWRGWWAGVGLRDGDWWGHRVGLRRHEGRTHRAVLLRCDLLIGRINGWVLGRDGEFRGGHTY